MAGDPDNKYTIAINGPDDVVLFPRGDAPGLRYDSLQAALEAFGNGVLLDFPSAYKIRLEVEDIRGEPAEFAPVDPVEPV